MLDLPKEFDELDVNGGNSLLPNGAYVCRISRAVVNTYGQLEVELPIADGPAMKMDALRLEEKGRPFISRRFKLEGKALYYFKRFINAVEASNTNYAFDKEENSLLNRLVGVVVQQKKMFSPSLGREFIGIEVVEFVPVADVRDGKCTVPEGVAEMDAYNKKRMDDYFEQAIPTFAETNDANPWG